MDIKEKLRQFQHLKCEIVEYNRQLKKMEGEDKIVKDKVRGTSPSFPWIETSFHIEGQDEQLLRRMERKKRRCERLISKCMEEEKEIEEFIEQIEDSRTRRVFTYRYLDGWSWAWIARKMNFSETHVRAGIHDDYLRKLQNK